MKHSKTDCRTQEGIIVGLIDSIITIAHVLKSYKIDLHDQDSKAIREAMKDLKHDDDVFWLTMGRTAKDVLEDAKLLSEVVRSINNKGVKI